MSDPSRYSDGLAPIALFAFKRPAHTRRTLEALAANPDFRRSPLFIYCDGARSKCDEESVEETRSIVTAADHPKKTLRFADANRGLAASIIGGVSDLCQRFGRVIVVEDDLIVSSGFLEYMNQALARYRDSPRVMQISGHMFPVDLGPGGGSLFLPFTTTWGWATWSRAWAAFDASAAGAPHVAASWRAGKRFDLDGHYPYLRMLQRQLAGEIDSWGIRWYLSVYLADGLTLYPRHSLVANIGFDGSGTHCGTDSAITAVVACAGSDAEAGSPMVDINAFRSIKQHLRARRGLIGNIKDWTNRVMLTRGGLHVN